MNKTNIPPRDPVGAYTRKTIAQLRVGEAAKCPCGETRPEALIRKGDSVMCAECVRKMKGHTTMDGHHYAGEANNPLTVPVPTNDHRADLSVSQMDWPKETLENPSGSPLLAAAGGIRGFIDWVIYLIRKGVLWVAEMLESLNKYLVEKLGEKWWVGTPLEQFAPKGK
jgi:hypothetical protein